MLGWASLLQLHMYLRLHITTSHSELDNESYFKNHFELIYEGRIESNEQDLPAYAEIGEMENKTRSSMSVSYTHLTLPTILLV